MKNKIAIIGAGYVGSTIAYATMNRGFASRISLIDIDEEKAEGEAMDLSHGAAFVKPVKVTSGNYEECADADVIVITAGKNQKPGQTRLDLVSENADILKDIIPRIKEHADNPIVLVVTNPVDILTYVADEISGFPRGRVLGSGTVLDTSRLRYLIGDHCEINTSNVHGYVIGEHGDREVITWSLTNFGGIPFDKYCQICDRNCNRAEFKESIEERVKNAAYEVIDRKGATNYAVGLAVAEILEAIIRDERKMLTVTSRLNGQYGLTDVALGLPSIVGGNGVEKALTHDLSSDEEEELIESGRELKETGSKLDL
ncbi:L-lactate dehydrogenase [Candidatus Bipolaricaulota bacterium]|nr:L-lactate dehydrogenase [Candidatus Bipolaricaulota bacterium]